MKNWMTVLCVVLAVCFATGVALAAEKPAKADGPMARGVVKSFDAATNTLVVTVKKEDAANDVTFTTTAETKVKQGKEDKALSDIKVGANVVVAYKEVEGAKTATSIRILAGEGGKHGK